MNRTVLPLLTALLAVTAGCLGGAGTATAPAGGSAASATEPATATPSAATAGERAVTAERSRIERVARDAGNLSGLRFGVVESSTSEVVRRNGTGVVVRVEVAYGVSVDCDGDGEPDSAVDGANTVARYFVTSANVRLLGVSQAFLDPATHC